MRKNDKTEELIKWRGSTIELNENREAVIEGCKFVINYDENNIELKLGETCVRFTGSDLIITSFIYGQAVITGVISSIEFYNV